MTTQTQKTNQTTKTTKTNQTTKTKKITQIPWGGPLPSAPQAGEKVWLWSTLRYSVGETYLFSGEHSAKISIKSARTYGPDAWTFRLYEDGKLTKKETTYRWTDIVALHARYVVECEETRKHHQAVWDKWAN